MNLSILNLEVDEVEDSYYRCLIDGKYVKYLTIDAGVYNPADMTWDNTLISQLPIFPPGDWNSARISRDLANGKAHFTNIEKADLPEITSIWHPVRVEMLQLNLESLDSRPNVCRVIGSRLNFNTPAIAKYARFPWEQHYFDLETAAYEWIEGFNIGPRFLGHLMENGRVVGFLIEDVQSSRTAGIKDLEACRETLSKMHELGIKHGDINRHNFLVRDGQALVIDLDCARRCDDKAVLDTELQELEETLSSTSIRGGMEIYQGIL